VSLTELLLGLLALVLVRAVVLEWWWFSPLRAETDEEFVERLRHLNPTLSPERLLKYRRQVARAMGVPRRHVLAEAPLSLYERFHSGILAVQPSDVLDEAAASLARLGREGEESPKTVVQLIRLFAEDDDRSKQG
jgi:hypothetical protein